jgi:hypothetical protein
MVTIEFNFKNTFPLVDRVWWSWQSMDEGEHCTTSTRGLLEAPLGFFMPSGRTTRLFLPVFPVSCRFNIAVKNFDSLVWVLSSRQKSVFGKPSRIPIPTRIFRCYRVVKCPSRYLSEIKPSNQCQRWPRLCCLLCLWPHIADGYCISELLCIVAEPPN